MNKSLYGKKNRIALINPNHANALNELPVNSTAGYDNPGATLLKILLGHQEHDAGERD